MAGAVQFWFEFASTYSYVAAMRVEGAAIARGVPVEWKPFLLGPLFQRQGWNDSPYNLYPARGRYMWRDIERLCDLHGLPFRRPTRFPRNSLLAARVAILGEGKEWLPEFSRAVYRTNFAQDRDIAEEGVIAGILDSLGQEGSRLVDLTRSPDTKERLRRQTERAWELGIFGAPSFVAREELFWGQDRLEQALDWPGGARSGESG
jgi:2-hydroxychromene-2-carboxylate isomerase